MQLLNLRWEEFIERLKRIRVSLKTFKRFEMMRTNRFQPFKGFEDKWILTKLWPRRAYKVWWPGCLIRDKWVGEDFAFCFLFLFSFLFSSVFLLYNDLTLFEIINLFLFSKISPTIVPWEILFTTVPTEAKHSFKNSIHTSIT